MKPLRLSAGMDFEKLLRTPRDQVQLPALQKRDEAFTRFECGVVNLIGGLFEDLFSDVRKRTEAVSSFVTHGSIAQDAMRHDETQTAPESLGQRLSNLQAGLVDRDLR